MTAIAKGSMNNHILTKNPHSIGASHGTDIHVELLGAEFAAYPPDVLQLQAELPRHCQLSWRLISALRVEFDALTFSARRDVLMSLTKGELASYV